MTYKLVHQSPNGKPWSVCSVQLLTRLLDEGVVALEARPQAIGGGVGGLRGGVQVAVVHIAVTVVLAVGRHVSARRGSVDGSYCYYNYKYYYW